MTVPITAAMLYDLVACPHRVTMDLFADPMTKDKPNAFVQLLWEKGSLYEKEVIEALTVPFLDLSQYSGEEKENLTTEAIEKGESLIYGGRIQTEGLLGDPDLLRNEGGGYIAGDIKSGAGEEGSEGDSKPKKHYAVQLGLYTDILERKGVSSARRAFVWDVNGEEVIYDFDAMYGTRNPRRLWDDYQDARREAEAIIRGTEKSLPAYSSVCKLCHWYTACVQNLRDLDDLTIIPELGRTKRDAMQGAVPTVSALASSDPQDFRKGKKTQFPGIGPNTLERFYERANLLTTAGASPFLRTKIALPSYDRELFFDIEVDPMRDLCYLHGFVERQGGDNDTELYAFRFAGDPTDTLEKKKFAEALTYIASRRPCAIYYYSKYERTIYRKLQKKYPDVCSADEVEELFDPSHAVDLYTDVVKKFTEWPTWDYSIKSIASYLEFKWRDTHPSGAASIEWFNDWVNTGNLSVRRRILEYNEDDCRATRVLRDAIENLPIIDEELV